MFRFEHKEFFLILLILPVLAGLYLFNLYWRKRNIRIFGNPELISTLMPDFSQFRKNLKFILLLLASLFIILAIVGPQFGSKLTEVRHEGVEIIVALDISNSMLAEDVKPNRLERAKQELSLLLDRLNDDRIGLIIFAGEAYTQIPITNDYLSAKMFLSGINTQMITKQGTDIGAAIHLALRSFDSRSQAGKAIVIISDGENHEGGVSEAIKKANEMGIKIFTVGMGTNQGVRIPSGNNPNYRDYHRDREGNFVVTRMNESMLMEIASSGGGEYYRANMPNMGMNTMLARLNSLNKAVTEYKVFSEFEEQFPAMIWFALGMLFLEFLLLERKNKWLKNILLFNKKNGMVMKSVLLIFLAAYAVHANSQTERRFIRKGNGAFEDGQYQQAEIEYRKALEKAPLSGKADYNLGNALYKQKQYDAAATKYAALAEKGKDKQTLNRYYYNLGNALYENRKYQESVEAYKNSLRNDPRDLDAKHNLQMAMKRLTEQQQQNKNDQQKKQDQQNKDRQNMDQKGKDQNSNNQPQKGQPQDKKGDNPQQPQQVQPSTKQISPEDAERILRALENEEKNVIRKVQEQKEHMQQVPLEKNW
jgi:tetratricopeptide (TPR) repeat protein